MAHLFGDLRRERVCYINAAGRTPLPTCTREVGLAALVRKAETPWDIGDTERDKDEARALFAKLLGNGPDGKGVSPSDIAVVPCCSYAMTLAANNMRGRMRSRPSAARKVVVIQDQNPSNVLQWQRLCEDEDGELVVIGRPADGDWAREIVDVVATGTVAVCALPPCHWCDGSIIDLRVVSTACQAHNASLVVDGTQWVGAAEALDVHGLAIAFLACSIHKWLLGPYGACLCYAPRSVWETWTPLEDHDRNREGAQHVECLPMAETGYPTTFQAGCRRLDGGGRPSYIVMPMLARSLRLLVEELTVARVAAQLGAFTAEVGKQARALGFDVPPRHAPNIIGLRPTAAMPDADAIVAALAARPLKIIVGARLGVIRVSPHLYNDQRDLDHLIEGLRDAIYLHRMETLRVQPAAEPTAANLGGQAGSNLLKSRL